MRSPPHPLPPPVTASDPPQSCSLNPLLFQSTPELQRGIKWDISAYPTLKDEKYYESFKRSVLYSKIHALDMIVVSNLGPLQPLELPTNMNYLLTSMTIHITRTPPLEVPPMVALTCQLRNSTRSTLPTLIGLLMSPPLPLGSLPLHLPLADPPPKGPLAPSFFLPTSTNSW